MAILVTGAAGQLGSEICARLGQRGLGVDVDQLDLTNAARIVDYFASELPDAVINCAAYTQVDRAEREAERCRAINADAVHVMAETCRTLDIPLVQISTDYVFGGDRGRTAPYTEDDAPAPLSVYAASKLAGERHAASWRRHIVVRSCGLYAAARPGQQIANFAQTMLRLAREREVVRVVADQICSPTYVPNLAAAVLFLLENGIYGTYHVVDRGAISWHGFAEELFRQAGLSARVEAISTADYVAGRIAEGALDDAIAPRPAYSVLAATKYESLGGPPMPTWQEGIAAYLAAAR
ncbi:MAG: dTDP-4-dehydrorhamnose reductase [Pirellulales bacterium]